MSIHTDSPNHPLILVAGGGAAGCFAAIACKEKAPDLRVILVEKNDRLLQKVSLSGGGRCNCSNRNIDMRNLAPYYPRGAKFLRTVFSRFNEHHTIDWFASRGVQLKTEPDGRVFPQSDRSSSITAALENELLRHNIEIVRNNGLHSATPAADNQGFHCILENNETYTCESLIITTGGTADSAGISIARLFGHTISSQVPSLFSFKINNDRLNSLPGVAVHDAAISLVKTPYSVTGDLLITHSGISGPAVIKLSSYAAREMYKQKYSLDCRINWYPQTSNDHLYTAMETCRKKYPEQIITNHPLVRIPLRLWKMLALSADCTEQQQWAHLTSRQREMLVQHLTRFNCHISGRDTNKDEFVTCGGVSCSQLNAATMESRSIQGLFFAGEVIDIDGITGGFNLQAAWSTGWLAGISAAQRTKAGDEDRTRNFNLGKVTLYH